MKTAIIFDLDNTIYPVSAIADNLFAEQFALLDQNSEIINKDAQGKVDLIKEEMTRRPFQYIADKYELDDSVREQLLNALRKMTYDLPMQPFDDYHHLKTIPIDKYLVTTGFPKLQYSKIKQLGIEQDFKEIIVVDPDMGRQTKKDVFADILSRHKYQPEEVLIIGDDPDSEIKAALSLGIDTFLFDPKGIYTEASTTHRSNVLKDALLILR